MMQTQTIQPLDIELPDTPPLGPPDPARLMEALTYKAPFLIEKLIKERIVETAEEAEILFAEAIKYLILSRLYPTKQWNMISRLVDEAWHQFVLFTAQYAEFGKRYFGRYLHHAPSNSPSAPQRAPSEVPSVAEFAEHYTRHFGTPLPAVWNDRAALSLKRRILLNDTLGEVTIGPGDEPGLVAINSAKGELAQVSDLAREALDFMVGNKVFYIRELPGDLSPEEKVGLVAALIAARVLTLGV